MKSSNELLADHFDRLKTLVPELYLREPNENSTTTSDHMYRLLKRTLGIVEAIYLKNTEGFNPARLEEYAKVITELKSMGYAYEGPEELMENATNNLLLKAKKPMRKAKGGTKIEKDDQDRQAI